MLQANSTYKGNKKRRSIHGGARDIATTDAYVDAPTADI
jgi:hypothetical protein